MASFKFSFSEQFQQAVIAEPSRAQNFPLRKPELMLTIRPISSHPEGRTRRHLRGTRMRWTQAVPDDGMRHADGKGVWSCPPDAGVKPIEIDRSATEANKPGTPGRARYKP
jgi:hypothetical protein